MNPIVSQFNIWRYLASAGSLLEKELFNQKGLYARCEAFSPNGNSWSSIMFAFNHPLKNIIQIIMPLIVFGYVCKESSIKKSSYQRRLKHNSYSWRQSSLASLISVSKLSVFIGEKNWIVHLDTWSVCVESFIQLFSLGWCDNDQNLARLWLKSKIRTDLTVYVKISHDKKKPHNLAFS